MVFPFCFLVFLLSLNLVCSVPINIQGNTATRPIFSQTPFSQAEAKEKLLMSSAAYCHNRTNLSNWSCLPCQNITHVKPVMLFSNETEETFGYVAVDTVQAIIYIVFRGTVKELPNIEIDADSFQIMPYPQTFPEVKVHQGFHNAYLSVRDQLIAGIRAALMSFPRSLLPSISLHFTGHSLGAALTTIAAVDIRLSLDELAINQFSVYNFGSPRVGNLPFVYLYDKSVQLSYRVTHWRDLVVHLPPKTILGQYVHINREVFYDSGFDQYKICSDQEGIEDGTCSGQFGVLVTLGDHLTYFGIRVGRFCNTVA
eukprot:TRINITY_DN8863_c0_g1_i1.p1 TRINITY_DN8863_c0_g1~~TRINITY_DN8863_c0_g1_i1.p1  ORF type:complete len:312 (-),score=32.71 TRINITY_DN8863_c0_g1_i1:119-1054(-)